MSVLIRKMEMPKGCWACPFVVGKYYECLFTKKSSNWGLTTRPSDCPLIGVPTPHGRLIDADAFKETIDYYIREANWSDAHNEALGWAKEFIDNEQAVIEAEGSET